MKQNTYINHIYIYVHNCTYIICKCIKRSVFLVFQIRVVYGHIDLDLLVRQHSLYIKSSGDSEPPGQGKYLCECDTSHYVHIKVYKHMPALISQKHINLS